MKAHPDSGQLKTWPLEAETGPGVLVCCDRVPSTCPPSTPENAPGLPGWGASSQETGQTSVKASRLPGDLSHAPPTP